MDSLLSLAQSLAQKTPSAVLPIPKRIAYVVSHGQSYASNGYAIRTQGVAQALNEHGFETLCFVRPGRPWELQAAQKDSVTPETVVKGVRYIHSRWPDGTSLNGDSNRLEASVEKFIELFSIYRPEVVLAASNYIVGLPAWVAAQRLGIPFYNEVRGFWELSRDAREPGYANTPEFKLEAERDTFVAKQALKVFTLNQPMKEELAKRGVDPDNIELVPNGVSELPEIKPADPALKKKLGIQPGDKVVGYVGSFNRYEGLDTLVGACAELVKQGEPIKLLLVGDDQPVTEMVAKPEMLADKPWLIQVGRVPHEQVGNYYALIDVVVIPRKKLPVCEIVPPMKLVEALAYGKRVVVSDVAPLVEYVGQSNGVFSYLSRDLNNIEKTIQKILYLPVSEVNMGLGFSEHTERMVRILGLENAESKEITQRKTLAPNKQSKNSLGVLSKPNLVDLPQKDPVWHKISVKTGQSLIIKAASEYRNVIGPQNRKAVLLINSFDAQGNVVDKPCGKMSKSGHLKSYFKYLPSTQNQIQELHSFTVPKGVSEIHLGLCGFNKKEGEQVFVRELSVKPKSDKAQLIEFVPPSELAAEISILGWPEQLPNGKPYVIGIMDEFTTGCFEEDLNLIQPRPDNWYALAEKYKPDFFFIESAWKGNFGSWQYRVADYTNKPGQEVAHICQYAREKGIPTLFWNKEDPVHHDKFMCSAKLVDHIFTTDANMKDSYRVKTGNLNVHALPFAAQPALHKPAPLTGRKQLSCFAGSWYGNRHAERGQAMQWLLQSANKYGLDIYDRNYGTGVFPFPEEYEAGIKGSLPYKELCDEYNRYRVFLNVNSVTESPTMFSRRVFELMACGTPVVSTYAKGIENLFESDAVWMVRSEEEANHAIHTLMTNDVEWRRRSLAGIREVFSNHTYAHRLNDIFDHLGIETRLLTDPMIALVAKVRSHSELESLDWFARKQNYRNFRLGVMCSFGLVQLGGSLSDEITLIEAGQEKTWLAKKLTEGATLAGSISASSRYEEYYLRDLVNASLYEPKALGWAKALKEDQFSYGGKASQNGMLWRSAEFMKRLDKLSPSEWITHPDIYVADSDQFKEVSTKNNETWKVNL